MAVYMYDGPVEYFGKCIADRWTAYTTAPTEDKARINLEYKFKKESKKEPWVKIVLPGKITKV